MAELATIARPYAEAAFKLATEQNALPVWGEMLKFAAAVMKDPAMAGAIDNPKLGAEQKESLQLKNAAEGVAKAEIVSAIALTDAQVGELKAVLEKRFGKKIEATVSVDPSLIGGARIVVGDQVVDCSIAGKLQAMATQLKS